MENERGPLNLKLFPAVVTHGLRRRRLFFGVSEFTDSEGEDDGWGTFFFYFSSRLSRSSRNVTDAGEGEGGRKGTPTVQSITGGE